jgi:ParB family chromosome partitioning protein
MRIDKAKIRTSSDQERKNDKLTQRVSAYTEAYKGEYYNIEVLKLIPFKNQPRKHFDQGSLDELASTIRTHGIRQPLTILPSAESIGKYEIVSGERRWKAAQIAGLTKVPCIIIHNQNDAEEIALIENIQREDLHPLELMQAFKNLLDRKICKSTSEIANKLGLNKSMVVETLALNSLPQHTQQILLDEGIKARKVLRELGKENEEKHLDIISNYKKIIKEKEKKPKLKVISIIINNEEITFQGSKIDTLTSVEKQKLKQSLMAFVKSISLT